MMSNRKKLLLSVTGLLYTLSFSNNAFADPDPERNLTATCQPEPGAADQHNCFQVFYNVPMGGWAASHLYYFNCSGTFNHATDFSSSNGSVTWGTTGGTEYSSIHRNGTNWSGQDGNITIFPDFVGHGREILDK